MYFSGGKVPSVFFKIKDILTIVLDDLISIESLQMGI